MNDEVNRSKEIARTKLANGRRKKNDIETRPTMKLKETKSEEGEREKMCDKNRETLSNNKINKLCVNIDCCSVAFICDCVCAMSSASCGLFEI